LNCPECKYGVMKNVAIVNLEVVGQSFPQSILKVSDEKSNTFLNLLVCSKDECSHTQIKGSNAFVSTLRKSRYKTPLHREVAANE
jgi:hypothetical protein